MEQRVDTNGKTSESRNRFDHFFNLELLQPSLMRRLLRSDAGNKYSNVATKKITNI